MSTQHERELDAAFDSPDPVPAPTSRAAPSLTVNVDNGNDGYDFEREYEYDVPPPGSPSALAHPNDWGNSNGLLPAPVTHSLEPPVSWWRRFIPFSRRGQAYSALPTTAGGSRVIGGGTDNDGVFANVAAKPSTQASTPILDPEGNVHLVPEDMRKDAPPTYADAQADAAPSYNSAVATVFVSSPSGSGQDVAGDDDDVGSISVFLMHATLSWFFQFIGFILTFMMSTNLAGRTGSRAGLGATLVQFGFYLKNSVANGDIPPSDTSDNADMSAPSDGDTGTLSSELMSPESKQWMSFALMAFGWFILLHAILSFWRAKRWAQAVNTPTSTSTTSVTRADYDRDIAVRRNLESVFGVEFDPHEVQREQRPQVLVDENGHVVVIPDREALEEARLARDLRAAGLL
ncbi:hypothetical protein BDZ89DRAFT_1154081 [Hymenopellis radicata]|nr:hypothetical protein BDZ89DRAFT_1154081 [Hymenopellis radicata]